MTIADGIDITLHTLLLHTFVNLCPLVPHLAVSLYDLSLLRNGQDQTCSTLRAQRSVRDKCGDERNRADLFVAPWALLYIRVQMEELRILEQGFEGFNASGSTGQNTSTDPLGSGV